MNIPAGYQVHLKSWENDADYYKTEIISGLTKEEVSFYIELAKKFYSQNGWPDKKGLGNGATDDLDLIWAVRQALTNHPNISPELLELYSVFEVCDGVYNILDIDFDDFEDWNVIEEIAASISCDLINEEILGHPECEVYQDMHNFCRAFDSYKIFFFETEVKEVSSEF